MNAATINPAMMNPAIFKLVVAWAVLCQALIGQGEGSVCLASDYFTLVPPDKHVAVGKVTVVSPQGESSGTGTLIGPNLVLTAAHVVADAMGPELISFTITLPNGKTWTSSVVAYRTHPHYLVTSKLSPGEAKVVDIDMLAVAAADVAILRLEEKAPAEVGKLPQLGALPTEVGSPAEAVGFGLIEGMTAAGSAKRSGQLEFYEKSKQHSAIFRTPPGKLQRTNHGDSGGPLLVQEGDVARIVAITQGYRNFDKLHGLDPSSYGLYTSIEDNRRWIDGAIKELEAIRFVDTPYYFLKRDPGYESAQLALTRQQIAGLLSIGTPDVRVIQQVLKRGMNEPIPQEVVEGWVKKYSLKPELSFVPARFSQKTLSKPTTPTKGK